MRCRYFHAGSISAAADSAGGYACLSALPLGSDVLSVEFKVNLMRPAVGAEALAIGKVGSLDGMVALSR